MGWVSKWQQSDNLEWYQVYGTTYSMIQIVDSMEIPTSVREYAETIKLQSYKTTTPTRFKKTFGDDFEFKTELSKKLNIPVSNLEYVFFSVCAGAEPHIEELSE